MSTHDSHSGLCSALPEVDSQLVADALALTFGTSDESDLAVRPHCDLEEHHPGGEHWAYLLILELNVEDTPKSVWTHWRDGEKPSEVVVRVDCPVSSPVRELCCVIFAGHEEASAHTWEMSN